MNGDKLISIVLWVLSLVLAIVFFYNGIGKILGFPNYIEHFGPMGLSAKLLIAVGLLECFGGVMLTISRLSVAGAILLGLIMLTSAALHLIHDDNMATIRAAMIVIMLVGICNFRLKKYPEKN